MGAGAGHGRGGTARRRVDLPRQAGAVAHRAAVPANALHRLYEDFLNAGLFNPAEDTLRLLRRVDPMDQTGAADLWERGWRECRGATSPER